MTNAIEQTKREMYEALKRVNACFGDTLPMAKLESAMEAHLEELRKDKAVVQAHLNDKFDQLALMTNERDAIQLRLHAVDHAYNESQKTVGRQIDVIASLQDRLAINAREKRETGTCGQVCADRGDSERTDAKDSNLMAILGAVIDCHQLVSDWAVYGYRAKKQMKKMAYVLNNNPELRAALDHFEGRS